MGEGGEDEDTLIMAPLLVEKLQVSHGIITVRQASLPAALGSQLTNRKQGSARRTPRSCGRQAITPSRPLRSPPRSSCAR